MEDEAMLVACMPGLSHGAFRLYMILIGAERQRNARNRYFPITLNGLQRVHPGTANKGAGITTVFKQVAELRRRSLLEVRGALPRDQPYVPVMIKVVHPDPRHPWETTDGSILTVREVGLIIESQ